MQYNNFVWVTDQNLHGFQSEDWGFYEDLQYTVHENTVHEFYGLILEYFIAGFGIMYSKMIRLIPLKDSSKVFF